MLTRLAMPKKCFNPFMTEALSYRNQSIDLLCKSMDWFLYDRGLRQEIDRSSRHPEVKKNDLTGKKVF